MKELTPSVFDALLLWYNANKRELPWRGTPSPYEVWVSEIMLQQTRVETVRAYFTRWMLSFPTVYDLAKAEEEKVLKEWEGLGYYSRARNLQKAAKIIVDKFNGEIPCDKKSLLSLPGVGEYTAGAILSIAFGQPEPAVDGNVLRVLSRLLAEAWDISSLEVRRQVADTLRPHFAGRVASDLTQALFEIGALVCLPDDAFRCDRCPLRAHCAAATIGEQGKYPVKIAKPQKKEYDYTVFVLEYKGKYALRKRPNKGLLAGLFELPNLPGALSLSKVQERFTGKVTELPAATHVFTHVIWHMKGYLVQLNEPLKEEGVFFAEPLEIQEKYSLPSAFSAYKKYCLPVKEN